MKIVQIFHVPESLGQTAVHIAAFVITAIVAIPLVLAYVITGTLSHLIGNLKNGKNPRSGNAAHSEAVAKSGPSMTSDRLSGDRMTAPAPLPTAE